MKSYLNYFNLNENYLFYVRESGISGNIHGDQFEDNAMFLSVLNICRINPDIDMKNIRILIAYFFISSFLLFSQDIDKYLQLINEGRINDVISD